jgi:hypothetical protein
MKKILFFLILLFGFYIITIPVLAKENNQPVIIFDRPMFSSAIVWMPGNVVTKNIKVINSSKSTEKFKLKAANFVQKKGLADILKIKIHQGNNTLYEKSLRRFWSDGVISLAEIRPRETKNFSVTISMPSAAGNEYQRSWAKFDFVGSLDGRGEVLSESSKNEFGSNKKPDHCRDSWWFKFFRRCP